MYPTALGSSCAASTQVLSIVTAALAIFEPFDSHPCVRVSYVQTLLANRLSNIVFNYSVIENDSSISRSPKSVTSNSLLLYFEAFSVFLRA